MALIPLPGWAVAGYTPTVIVTNQTELNTELAKTAAQLEGKVIGVQYNATPYVITRTGTPNLRNKDFGAGRLVICGYGAPMPVFSEINADGTSNCTLYGLEVVNTTATSGNLVTVYTGAAGSTGVTIQACKIHGKYYDPNGDYSTGWGGSAFGIRTSGGGPFIRNLAVLDCEIFDCDEAFNAPIAVSGDYVKFIGNTAYRCYSGMLNITSTVVPTVTEINWNVMYQAYGMSTDLPDLPHVDFIQFQGGAVDRPGIEVIGNVLFAGDARGDAQGIFLDDMDIGKFFTASIKGNAIVCKNQYSGIAVRDAKNCTIIGNTIISASAGQAILPRIVCGDRQDGGGSLVKNSTSPSFLFGGSVTSTNNYEINSTSSAAYTAMFQGTSFNASDLYTRAQVLAALAMKTSGPLDQAVNIGAVGSGYVNFDARTLNTSME